MTDGRPLNARELALMRKDVTTNAEDRLLDTIDRCVREIGEASQNAFQQAAMIEAMRTAGAQDAAELKECRSSVTDLTRENTRLRRSLREAGQGGES